MNYLRIKKFSLFNPFYFRLWTKYKNSGRQDGVELYRWQRSDENPTGMERIWAHYHECYAIVMPFRARADFLL